MKPLDMNTSRRPPVRMDAQDGPWSVSVAETPHDARSYSLYIKTPTHNLTLTRSAMEIVDLHQKLRDSYPVAKLPALPIDVSTLPAPPAKRKSNFLNTLSRLASPSSNRSARQASNRHIPGHSSAIPSTLPTPLVSPSHDGPDPFASFSAATNGLNSSTLTSGTHANSTVTGLASYLTSISNEPTLRQARHWKRFVRVRPDDLESVRVERAIKRVRSDLASHVSPKSPEVHVSKGHVSSTNVSVVDSHEDSGIVNGTTEANLDADGITEEEEGAVDVDVNVHEEDTMTVEGQTGHDAIPGEEAETLLAPIDVSASTSQAMEEDVSTPMPPDTPAARIPRSQSADPDKATRLSRVYTNQEGASSQTGDESSISTTAGGSSGRKKRSRSSDPKRELKKSQRKVVVDDFEMLRVLGKGCAGKVLLVRHKSTTDLYALKAITKRHVLAHQELQHTLTEQAVLKRMAAESKDPFVVKLWWSFHDKENLFLVMDFHPGGDLATQLARWGRLGRDRARFYAAEIVEGVEGLHAAGVIYRDLKPENILIGADGHIVLTDFGLSKEFPRRTASITAPSTPAGLRGGEFYSSSPTSQPATPPWLKGEKGQDLAAGWPGQVPGQGDSTSTFCGTAEYLAPEVIQGLQYSYEVDWWSFGTMLYEMLTGITPFWANNHSDMYVRVLQDELQFPDDRAIDQDTKSLIRGLLQRNPALRMCEPRIKRHPYFSMIDWSHVYYKRYIPPYIPPIDPSNASDTQNFDDTFLDMEPVIDDPNENEQTDTDQEREQTDTDRTDGEESNTTPSQSRSPSVIPPADDSVDVFDGYSFKGRHSILIDSDEDEESGDEEDEEDESPVADEAEASKTDLQTLDVSGEVSPEERTPEPKTPEAHQPPLPEATVDVVSTPTESPVIDGIIPSPLISQEGPAPEVDEKPAPVLADSKRPKTRATRATVARPGAKASRVRREKSGVPALDRDLSDTIDEDGEMTEKEEDDDDWDFVEAADGEDRNGAQGTSLFARGVVDRYRLAVFRKASGPAPAASRSFSATSKASDLDGSELADSPTPSDKQRRGRTQGLTFRKHPRQFLQPKSQSKKSNATKNLGRSTSASLSVSTTSSPSMPTPSPSVNSTLPVTPSLKSKESHASSVGTHSGSSDQSPNADSAGLDGSTASDTVRGHPPLSSTEEPEKLKSKKLKKYKEGAEKVLSLFASPRQS
ncbi:hypothetical protein PILCRDRAFT_71075 [Piloderma croceum F 1598]|uniref:non-specific serine/threonine protein kinase n=1 Tax=Piloderma croceum (strain F 1598) TaxID=765440 RepID=A0A0C3FCI7_PILCF|nr:hypothetical protein PILCRDRAFT_71075 [Piloderma croceum F 1598]